MINFKTFLTESKSAPLYHSTDIQAAERIMSSNTLHGTVQEAGATKGKKVIFFTRDIRQAKHYMNFDNTHQGVVIFVFDQLKLNNRYKIKPIKNWVDERADYMWDSNTRAAAKLRHEPMYRGRTGVGGNEFEEIIEIDKIPNISNYITKIIVNREPDAYKTLKSDSRIEVRR